LFEPLKSADPPINSGKIFVIVSRTAAEDFLEAIVGFESKNFLFSFSIILSRFFGNFPLISLVNSSFIFFPFFIVNAVPFFFF